VKLLLQEEKRVKMSGGFTEKKKDDLESRGCKSPWGGIKKRGRSIGSLEKHLRGLHYKKE